MADKQQKNVGLVAGVAAASAVAGAVAATMLTPKSGRELRDDIKDKAHEASDKLKNKSEVVTDKAEKKVSSNKPEEAPIL